MKSISQTLVFIVFLFSESIVAVAQEADYSACLACEELLRLLLPEVYNLESEMIEESTRYCRLQGTIGKEINFELLLPAKWNQRFVMGGGGGFVGNIQNAARHKVHEGYATVGTDTGHQGSGIQADWAYNNMERQLNYGHLAVHRTAEVAKVIIELYYCQAPIFSYFIGCSRGGGQAMHEAQRYPDDFDGIVAAAPVISFTATGAEFIQNSQVLYPDPKQLSTATISPNQVKLLQEAVLAQCDDLDGVTDRIINDPRKCNFDFSKLPSCKTGIPLDQCYSTEQIDVIKEIYKGPKANGVSLYPGFPVGGENEPGGWMNWIVGPDMNTMKLNFPNLHFAFGTELCKYLIFNDPEWDYASYDFANFPEDAKYAAAYLDATSTDYSAFKNRGGKIIFSHGWNDPALSAFTTIEHYEQVKEVDPQLDDFMKLYLLPGVLHCGGGPGPDQADWVEVVRKWVENKQTPEKIVVSKFNDGALKMSRPVFPFPSVAQYDGKGDPNVESSYLKRSN
ncbi:MAG: tannase/feruloyl esterase family alpha/beta hydrolase [Saprospiraceae bacterium]|nr:tannase/feruloyl esterase family alpha/beta hydrolase [Saprospiraceae bacterium]